MKLTIGKKIFLGYIPILVLFITISLFTLYKLYQVNLINNEIVTVDLVVNKEAENLIEILLAQESFGQRFIILKSQDMLSLFWKRDQEFKTDFQKIKVFSLEKQFASLKLLEQQHTEYNKYFQNCVTYLESTNSNSYALADSLRKKAFKEQISLLNTLISESRKKQLDKTWKTAEIGIVTFRAVSIFSITGIILIICLAMLISRGILRSIKTLKTATNCIAQGNFKTLPSVRSNDELGDLSLAFNQMALRLTKLEELYMDSSPLTRLPGGIAIENAVTKLIESKKPFAFCMIDLDNFKPFNDRYGYSRGNAVIKNTAKIMQQCSREFGTESDFIGHIGGDDFTLITEPEKFVHVCKQIISRFDKQILDFYNPEDRDNGFILSKNRKGRKLTFPIMSISISAINSEKSHVENYIEVGEIVAELKRYAKSLLKSNLVIDRRGGKRKPKS